MLVAALPGCGSSKDTADTAVVNNGAASSAAETPPIDQEKLKKRIDAVLDHTLNQRRLNTRDHAAWQIVHAILAFGRDLQLEDNGQLVNAVDYILANKPLTGWNLRIGDRGILVPVEEASKTGQGHPDQWLGYLSQTGLTPEDTITVAGQPHKIRELMTQAQWDLTPGLEATWTLMALSHPDFWPTGERWTARNGETWTLERLAEMEAKAPVVGGSCGGTHRLYALAVMVNRYRLENNVTDPQALTGGWAVAHRRVREFMDQAQRQQNSDGTFSGNYFARPGEATKIDDRIGTTGHIFEFLTAAMTDAELQQPWMLRACERLVTLMEFAQDESLDCGGLYHAAHGLLLYRERRWGAE